MQSKVFAQDETGPSDTADAAREESALLDLTAALRLFGVISVQFRPIQDRQMFFSPRGPTAVQPDGISLQASQIEYCSSALTMTRYSRVSSSVLFGIYISFFFSSEASTNRDVTIIPEVNKEFRSFSPPSSLPEHIDDLPLNERFSAHDRTEQLRKNIRKRRLKHLKVIYGSSNTR